MEFKDDELKTYRVEIAETVLEKLADIEKYIAEKFSSEAGKDKVAEILDSVQGLEIFPHAGFNADEKFGVIVN